MKIYLFLIIAYLYTGIAFAQNSINIIVRDSSNQEALIGATVTESGTKNGGTTDLDGRATFETSRSGNLVFSVEYLGYTTKNITLNVPMSELTPTVLLAPSEDDLEVVTVAAMRTGSRIEDIPTRVEVLGLDDINEENGVKPGNIMSLLGDIAGIQMQQVSASSGNTFARIQGLNGRYTQILKDGIPLFGGLSGGFGIMQIPPLDLKQIEIIKGSMSTLYGGDAIGGIINLVSKEPTKETEVSLTLNQSSLLESNINLYGAKRFKNVGFTLFLGQTVQQAVDVDKDGLSDSPLVNSTVIHPKLVCYLNPKTTLTLNYTATIDKRIGGNLEYLRPSSSDTLYHIYNTMNRSNFDAKIIHDINANKKFTLKISLNNTKQYINTKLYAYQGEQNILYTEAAYSEQHDNNNLVIGLNYNTDASGGVLANFKNNNATPIVALPYENNTIGLFFQDTWKPMPKFTIENGVRFDITSRAGLLFLPRISLLYKANAHITARLGGGLGYKIPKPVNYINLETDIGNFAATNNLFAATNNLIPERSQGTNADINYENTFFKKLKVTLNQSFFFTNLSRPIIEGTNNAQQITLYNAEQALQTQGLQTYARLRYQQTELYLGYVYTNVDKIYEPAHQTPYVTPKHNLSTTFFYEPTEHWRFGVESSFIAGQLKEDYQPAPDYFLLASMIQYNVGKFSFVLNGENLLDFRQNTNSRIYTGNINNPTFQKLWAPIDGRVINLSVKFKL